MRLAALLMVLVSCVACQEKPKALNSGRERNQAFLNSIADGCGLPRTTFQLIGDDHVQMQPAPNAKYESVDCALKKLLPNKVLKLGFVGNEYYSNEAEH